VRTVSAPVVARASDADLGYQISRASLLVAGAGVMGSLLLGVFGWVFLWLLGDAYTSALPVLLILLLGQVSLSVSGPVQLICNMRDMAAPASLLATIVAVAMILFLIPFHRPIEAAVIVALSMWVLNGGLWVIVYRKRGVISGIFSINKKVFQSEKAQLGADIQKLRNKFKGKANK
jgi:O-antigen/teichoic acid export membrane protein